jgi:ArsR family transcriptional regulator, virulence genes transcriptional regulator
MLQAAGAASELLKAIASPNRLMLLCQLIDGERSVGDLAQRLSLRPPTVSQHLALLRKDGLVSTRRDGQTIYYAIASPAAQAVIETLYRIYCAPECGSELEKPAPTASP